MQILLSDLNEFTLQALDNDDIGTTKDFLFDDKQWVVRYLVLDSHPWIPFSKKVLISPVSLDLPNVQNKQLPVKLSHKKIKDGPMLDDHAPVSRENEMQVFQHYGYAYYWMGSGLWGTFPHPGALVDQEELDKQKVRDNGEQTEFTGRLRSSHEVQRYKVVTQDMSLLK